MTDETIYKLDWQYDCWSDIETCFPKGSKVKCTVQKVARDYAFLSTAEGVSCFLGKHNVNSLWVVNDLTEEEEIKQGKSVECIVTNYNFDKKSLNVSLTLN